MTQTARKHTLFMYNIQHAPGKGVIESQEDKNRNYENFRDRVKKKSLHAYVDLGQEPELLRVYKQGSLFNSTVEYLVAYGSFEIIKGNSLGTQNKEIGFKAQLKTTDGVVYELIVLKEQYTATMVEVL